MKKIILAILAIIIVVGGIFVAKIFGSLDEIIKTQIEKQGSHYLQTSVTVDSVRFALLDGLGEINQLAIANPDGFAQPNALAFKQFRLDIDIKSVTTPPFTVQELLIDSPSVTYEVNAQGQGNLQALQKALEAQLPASQPSSQPEPQASSEDPLVAVKKVTVKEVQLTLDLSALGAGSHEMTLPTFDADPVGVPDGVPASQAGALIVKSMLSNLIKQAKKQQEQKLKDQLEDKAKDKLRDLLGG